MEFRKFKLYKIGRSKIIKKMQKEGSKLHIKKLNDKEFAKELRVKFLEEANEVFKAETKEELIEELADVLEVIDSLCNINKFTFQDILEVKIKKHQQCGGFDSNNYITVAEHPVGSFSEKCCLKDTEKYPEIIDENNNG